MNAIPKKISQKWLGTRKSIKVVETLADGSINPNYVSHHKEIADAEAELSKWEQFIELASTKGFKENGYSGKTKSGKPLDAGKGFYAKENGRVVLFTREEVAELIGW